MIQNTELLNLVRKKCKNESGLARKINISRQSLNAKMKDMLNTLSLKEARDIIEALEIDDSDVIRRIFLPSRCAK